MENAYECLHIQQVAHIFGSQFEIRVEFSRRARAVRTIQPMRSVSSNTRPVTLLVHKLAVYSRSYIVFKKSIHTYVSNLQ